MSVSTLLGHVGSVAGATISVRQFEGVASGIAIIGGRSYRVGQVGSFVRIPQGYHDLYAIISEVGASATPAAFTDAHDRGERWLTVQLVGEIVEASFERGISQYPNVNDEVHLVTEDDLSKIYGAEFAGQIVVGRLANAESIPVRLDLDKLVTRHSAVLGSTGSGKSTTVASLLRAISMPGGAGFPSARILLLDIHGEYARALGDNAEIFRIAPAEGEKPLVIPFWALRPGDMINFLCGKMDDRSTTAILDKIFAAKSTIAQTDGLAGVDLNSMTVDSPIPYSLRQLWHELIDPEVKTWLDQAKTQPALVTPGDAASLRLPLYQPHTTTNTAPYLNNIGVLGIRKQLDRMRSRLLDRQFEFLLKPGQWEPGLNGHTENDLPELLESWIGHEKAITVLDLSGIPSSVLLELIGAILSIIYEALFWGRDRAEGGRKRPQLIVMEEAHRYLGREASNPAREMVQRIAKEGRKFGIGAMIVSQRPSEIDDTILSQCGTFVALRLTNSTDRSRVQAALPDNLSGIADSLSVLRTGEAIITGEAARLPVRCRVTLPPKDRRPDSEDPLVAERWKQPRGDESYDDLVASWRAQDPRWAPAASVIEDEEEN
ncbi:ATP-binding protein [Mesorhizobium sp. M0322]|uniref:ATP-binding protein n=1 Tax=Mesorhizobium sp. M0322 TaxID=2956937 RepID=UPI00333BEC04